MKRARVFGARPLGARHVVAVGLVHRHGIDHLEDAALDALQLVARAGNHQQQEEVGHRPHGRLRLPHAHRFDQDVRVAGGLAEQDGLARVPRHAAEDVRARATDG